MGTAAARASAGQAALRTIHEDDGERHVLDRVEPSREPLPPGERRRERGERPRREHAAGPQAGERVRGRVEREEEEVEAEAEGRHALAACTPGVEDARRPGAVARELEGDHPLWGRGGAERAVEHAHHAHDRERRREHGEEDDAPPALRDRRERMPHAPGR